MGGRIGRRTFLVGSAGAAVGTGAGQLPEIVYLAGPTGGDPPKRLLREGVAFQRAYLACPDQQLWGQTLATGLFPHAFSSQHKVAGLPGRWIDASSSAEAERALQNLDLTARFQDTAVIFISKPGGDCPHDRCTRVSLVVRYPRAIRGGSATDFLASTVDIAPTLARLTGVALTYETHGRDLSNLLRTGAGERPESLYGEGQLRQPGEWRMVVRGLDKLVIARGGDVLHLYNLGEDPEEANNLAREPGHQLKVDELQALVRVWMKRTADGVDPSGLRRR
jgi:hypothetical protein